MRTKNSIVNFSTNLICYFIQIVVGFISRSLFIKMLGIEYLGINGLFTNIVSFLGIAELGIGNAIIFSLYKPVAENDFEKIKTLLDFYHKIYKIIGFIVLFIGLLIMPFIGLFVGEIELNINVYIIFLLFILQSCSTYILSYKTSIFIAYQKNYVVKINYIINYTVTAILQLIILYFTKNYYLYLFLKIITQILFNYIISKKADIDFPIVNDKKFKKIDKETTATIFSKVKGLLFHKIGSFVLNGTDNIIISKFINVYTVGLYSNYSLIFTSVNSLIYQTFNSICSSVGNLTTTERKEKVFSTFKKIRFINFVIACLASTCLLNCIQTFVSIWIGKEYLISYGAIIVLTIYGFQHQMRNSYAILQDATGIWDRDKYIPLLEAFLNIIASILFVMKYGLSGVFLGTIVSSIPWWFYAYPKYLYREYLNGKYINYIIETFYYFIIFMVISISSYCLCSLIMINNLFLLLLVELLLSCTITIIFLLIFFGTTNEFKYFCDLALKPFRKRENKI